MNWDALARQDRLRKWLRDNSLSAIELQQHNVADKLSREHDLDVWAKAAVRKVISRAKTRERLAKDYQETHAGQLNLALENLDIAIFEDNAEDAYKFAVLALNLVNKIPLASIDREARENMKNLLEIALTVTRE